MLYEVITNTANLDYIQNNMREIGERLKQDPAMATSLAFAGVPNANQGMGIAVLKPWSEREDIKTVLTRTNASMQDLPAMTVSTFQFPELPGAGGGLPLQFVITTRNNFV